MSEEPEEGGELEEISGIGPSTAEKLRRAGISSVRELACGLWTRMDWLQVKWIEW